MHHNTLIGNKKGFAVKTTFFLILLFFTGLLYFESRLIKDAFYFAIVLMLFIKFLVIKLYH
jgi:hypothetical protein